MSLPVDVLATLLQRVQGLCGNATAAQLRIALGPGSEADQRADIESVDLEVSCAIPPSCGVDGHVIISIIAAHVHCGVMDRRPPAKSRQFPLTV